MKNTHFIYVDGVMKMVLIEHSASHHVGYSWNAMTIVRDWEWTEFYDIRDSILPLRWTHLLKVGRRDWEGFGIVFETRQGVVKKPRKSDPKYLGKALTWSKLHNSLFHENFIALGACVWSHIYAGC